LEGLRWRSQTSRGLVQEALQDLLLEAVEDRDTEDLQWAEVDRQWEGHQWEGHLEALAMEVLPKEALAMEALPPDQAAQDTDPLAIEQHL